MVLTEHILLNYAIILTKVPTQNCGCNKLKSSSIGKSIDSFAVNAIKYSNQNMRIENGVYLQKTIKISIAF